MTDSKIIVRYFEDFGRMGSLGSTFACTELELRALKAWGSYHHGEVLGKHSDITGTFSDYGDDSGSADDDESGED